MGQVGAVQELGVAADGGVAVALDVGQDLGYGLGRGYVVAEGAAGPLQGRVGQGGQVEGVGAG